MAKKKWGARSDPITTETSVVGAHPPSTPGFRSGCRRFSGENHQGTKTAGTRHKASRNPGFGVLKDQGAHCLLA